MAVITGEPVPGIVTYFALGSASTPATTNDISDLLTGVEPSEDPDELEATTFRRQTKRTLPGFASIGYTLNGYYSPEAHAYFAPLRGMTNVAFEYGPGGDEDGQARISGLCTVFSYADPSSTVDAVPTFTVELRITERTDGVFPGTTRASAPAAAAKPARGIPARRGRRAA
jgi:hypothetical protein